MNTQSDVQHSPGEKPNQAVVTVTYNGLDRHLEVNLNAATKALLERAIHTFGSLPNPHTLSLFTQDGRELSDTQSLREQGVRDQDHLLLRPSTVKGG